MENNLLGVWAICDLYQDWSKSVLVHLMEISYTLLQVSRGMYEEARKQSGMEAEVNETKNTWFCRTSFSSSEGEHLSSIEKGNGDFYKLMSL